MQEKLNDRKCCRWVLGAGICFLILYYLPYMINGQNSYIPIWDTLESEHIFAILSAEHFFKYSGTVPELMDVNFLGVSALYYLSIFIYMIFPPFTAYMICDLIVRATAYIGMYLFLNLLFKNKYPFISISVAISFACINFFSILGLCLMGFPLICWAMYKIYKNEKIVIAYCVIVYYSLSTSLFYSGYVVIPILLIISIISFCKHKTHGFHLHFYIATMVLIFTQLLFYHKMVLLELTGFESFRDLRNNSNLYFLWGVPNGRFSEFFTLALSIFFITDTHTQTYHVVPIIVAFTGIIVGIFSKIFKTETQEQKMYFKLLYSLVTFSFAIAMLAAFLNLRFMSYFWAFFGLNSLDFRRFSYLLPFVNYTALAVSLLLIYQNLKKLCNSQFAKTICIFIVSMVTIAMFSFAPNAVSYYDNINRVFHTNKASYPTYSEFYDTELFSRIENFILNEYGLKKSEYKTGCLGLNPAAATYNRFHTIDGFVQTYSIEYWKAFRKIIQGELEKNKQLDGFFNWGSKCYLLANELHADTPPTQINELAFNWEAYYNIGGRFLFSSVPIAESALAATPSTDENLVYMNYTPVFVKEFHGKSHKIYLHKINIVC